MNHSDIKLSARSQSPKKHTFAICALLSGLIWIAFGRAIHYPYIVLDDLYYLSKNDMIKSGLNWKSIQWAFTTFQTGDWQPLTWLSWIISVQWFGLNPMISHALNILLHHANALLLFFILKKYTGAFWRSAFVAALFALHPFRVESVVWAAERKDVLAGLFWMLSLLAYYHYVQKPSWKKMSLVCFVFLLGLMSKPVLVSLPILFLFLDYWPLQRFKGPKLKILLEKIPLFALSLFSCVMTICAVRTSLISLQKIPLKLRFINAVASYGTYIGKTFWPHPLVNFYPHPIDHYSKTIFVLSLLTLIWITLWVFFRRRKNPSMLVGWLWFLIALFPMVGFVQVGIFGMADRYTYFAHIGFFTMLVWSLPEIRNAVRSFLLSGFVILSFTILSFFQTGYWRDSTILDQHTLEVTGQNPVVQNNLQFAVIEKGMVSEDVGSLLRFFAKPYNVEVPSQSDKTS